MTTATPKQDPGLGDLSTSEAQAWRSYTKSLEGLTGRAYDEAECRSWSRLERKLAHIEDLRAKLNTGSSTA